MSDEEQLSSEDFWAAVLGKPVTCCVCGGPPDMLRLHKDARILCFKCGNEEKEKACPTQQSPTGS